MRFGLLIPALTLFSGSYAHVISERQDSGEVEQYAPIPPASVVPLGPNGYYVENFGRGVYMVTDGGYQAMFVVSDKGVIVVDNPPTLGRNLLYAIGNVTKAPVTHFVYSHSHADHIGAANLFDDKVKRIAHRDTAELLADVEDPNRAQPKITFRDDYHLRVGNQTLELSYKGENHLRGNIFIYHPMQKVLMLVDVIFPGWTPFAQLGQVKNVPGYIRAHDQILEYDLKHFVGGHLSRSGTRQDVEIQKEYVTDLFNNCADTIRLSATNDTTVGAAAVLGPVLAQNPGNQWAAFRSYLEVTAEFCANKTNEKWLTRLAAADVFQESNAETMIESLRIDYGILGPFATM
ncbi:MAG: hypothetical protein M1817_001179 [Caeruleum heppii]|nr:MAG: hypothetical protein M1817_001179 [Caeruleum heppii]